jgi:CubicO group peptidase (beta-lactamase class C family)
MLLLINASAATADCTAPAVMPDGWAVSSPREQGLDPQLICSIGSGLGKLRDADPHGVVVIRHGMVVYERYFTGEDLREWSPIGVVPHDTNTLHNTESITKDVVALLAGIAFDRGWLRDLDDPIFSFLPEYADLRTPDNDRITIRHLLSMTSGLDWPERAVALTNPENIVRRGMSAPDPYRFVLEQPVEAPPGRKWNYNGGGVWLLGLILRKVAGEPLGDFANAALFEPLGITNWEWRRFPNGDPDTSGGLPLRPRDLAKFGQVVLDDGIWRGQQIVSASWVKQLAVPQPPADYGSDLRTPTVTCGGRAAHQSMVATSTGLAPSAGAGSGFMWCHFNLVVVVTAGLLTARVEVHLRLRKASRETRSSIHLLPAAINQSPIRDEGRNPIGANSERLCTCYIVCVTRWVNRIWEGMKMIVRILVNLLAIVATGIPAQAQNPSPIVGTWRVVSFEREIVETNAISKGFGGNAMGLVTFTPDGRMMSMVVDATRKPPAQPTATDAEAVSLYRTMSAYAGTYRVQGSEIIIHEEISSEQTTAGKDVTRSFKLDGERLTITTQPLVSSFLNNQITVTTVMYERVK